MNITLVLIEESYDIINKIDKYLKDQFDLEVDYTVRLLNSFNYDDGYEINIDGVIVTAYYNIYGDNVRKIDDESDISQFADVIASYFIQPKVYFTDDLEIAKKWLNRLSDTFSYDTESTGLALRDIGQYTMHSFSIDILRSFVLIDTPEIQQLILNFLTTTDKKIVCHNLAFDIRPVYRITGKFFKNYEDTQLIAQAYMNHTGVQAYSLKKLAGGLYGDWATAKTTFDLYEDSSEYVNSNLKYSGKNPDILKYNLPLVYYAGIDTSATLFLWQKFSTIDPEWKSVPIEDILPIQEPRDHEESPRYFYENVMKPLVRTIVELLETPMPIDMKIVEEIKQEALAQREPAYEKLQEFPAVKEYMKNVKEQVLKEFLDPLREQKSKWAVKVYKHNIADRTILCNHITGESRDSWKVADLKLEITKYPEFQDIIDKTKGIEAYPIVIEAMKSHKTSNQGKLQHKLDNPFDYIDDKKLSINVNASVQMKGLYKSLGLESDVFTPKKEESFNKDVIAAIAKTTPEQQTREIIEQVLLIAETKNLLSQYIKAYEGSYENGFCHGSIKFPGTISYRVSSAKGKGDDLDKRGLPLVTLPGVTKRATVAKAGWVLIASDFANLEGYIGALLMKDPMKKKILVDNYDSHCLHSSYYFTKEVERIMGIPFVDTLEFNQKFNKMRKENKELDKLRSKSKGVSFGLVYGAYPKKVAQTLKEPLHVGQALFDRFHNDLYPASVKYKEEYILPTAKKKGKIHLGLGAYLASNKPDNDIRSLGNATIQFWSILTLLAINKINTRIEKAGYKGKISIYSTVHDSIMAHVVEDLEVVQWYNNNLIECMTEDFLVNQEVKLISNCDIGYSYDSLVEIPNNCSIERIEQVLKQLKEKECQK